MTDEKTIIINLSKNELLYIDDSITIEASEQSYSTDAAVATDEFYAVDTLRNLTAEAKIAVPLHLVLKLGGALLAIIESGSKPELIDVSLTHAEIWLLRELSQSHVRVGNDPVGLNLKLKVHRALREINNSVDIGIDREADETIIDVQNALKEWKAQSDKVIWMERDNARDEDTDESET